MLESSVVSTTNRVLPRARHGSYASGGRRQAAVLMVPVMLLAATLFASRTIPSGRLEIVVAIATLFLGALILRAPALLVWCVVAVGTGCLIADHVSGLSSEGYGAAFAAALLGLGPIIMGGLRHRQDYPAGQVFGLVAVAYIVIGALAAAPTSVLGGFLTQEERGRGLVLMALFLGAVDLGIGIGHLTPTFRWKSKVSTDWVTLWKRALVAIALTYILSALIDLTGRTANLGAIPQLISDARLAFFLVLWVGALRREVPRTLTLASMVAALLTAVAGFGTGSLYSGLELLVGGLCIYVAERRRIPWMTVLLAVVVALSLNAGKAVFRSEYGGLDQLKQHNHLIEGQHFLAEYLQGLRGMTRSSLEESAARFSYAGGDLMGYVSQIVPSTYPHWDMRTYRYLPYALVPRVLVPSKPVATFGNQFGRAFGLLAPADLGTSANLPVSVEGYVNFGLPGLLTGGLVLGALLGIVASTFAGRDLRSMIAGTLFTVCLIGGVESDSTLTLGLVPGLVLVVALVAWVLRGRSNDGLTVRSSTWQDESLSAGSEGQ